MTLYVYFDNKKAGTLYSTEDRGVVFAYDESYLSDKEAQRLSVSLPLRLGEFSQKECMPFFSGLLPEEEARRKIADYLHVSETSTLKLLEVLGGECAGLISIIPQELTGFQKQEYILDEQNYQQLSWDAISDYIRKMPERPLIKADDKLRLSLAGAQEKLSLAKINGKWYLPLNGAPSTHILKPSREGTLSSLSQNEYICCKLAQAIGLEVPDVDIVRLAEKDVFVIERYDRICKNKTIKRLHQEDFCQAMGLMGTMKYQSDGGPGITDIFKVITNTCTVPAVETRKLLNYVIFNYLIGNCDAHGKNYSLLYKDNRIVLAPLYDLVSTTVYTGLTDKLSMKIGKHYEIKRITKEDFAYLAQEMQIKTEILWSIFEQFTKRLPDCIEQLKNDVKVDKKLLEEIIEGIKARSF